MLVTDFIYSYIHVLIFWRPIFLSTNTRECLFVSKYLSVIWPLSSHIWNPSMVSDHHISFLERVNIPKTGPYLTPVTPCSFLPSLVYLVHLTISGSLGGGDVTTSSWAQQLHVLQHPSSASTVKTAFTLSSSPTVCLPNTSWPLFYHETWPTSETLLCSQFYWFAAPLNLSLTSSSLQGSDAEPTIKVSLTHWSLYSFLFSISSGFSS